MARRSKALSALFDDAPQPDIKPTETVPEKPAEPVQEVQLLELIPGKTVIGKMVGKVKGDVRHLTIFYGNFVTPLIDGKIVPIKDADYRNMLDAFFVTEEGRKYRKPSEEEIKQARKIVQERIKNRQQIALEEDKEEEAGDSSAIQSGRTEQAINNTIDRDRAKEGVEVNETTHFFDDPIKKEKEAAKIIKDNFRTKAAIKDVQKELHLENRKNAVRSYIFAFIALVILVGAVFIVKDLVLANYQTIEMELTDEAITLKQGDPFVAQNYLQSVTDADNIYVIYPTLETKALGTYELEYVATNNTKSVKKVLAVNVVDGTAPTLTLTKDEILLVRDRDEEGFDLLDYVEICKDETDGTLTPKTTPLDWNRDEQVITFQVFDNARNQSTAQLTVHIEDKVECVKNATYDPETNTCSCDEGYQGDGTSACKLIPKSSGSSYSNTSNSSGTSNGASASGNNNTSGTGSTSGNGGSTTPSVPSTPTPPPAPANPYINISGSVSVPVGTDMGTILNMASACVSSYSGMSYSVNCSVNPTVTGSGSCLITADDGASASVGVTITD